MRSKLTLKTPKRRPDVIKNREYECDKLWYDSAIMKTEIEPDFTQPQLSVLYKYCDLRKNTESTVQSYIKRVASVCSEHCVTSTK